MKLYSDFGPRRTRQVILDLVSLAFVIGWVWLGVAMYGLIAQLAGLGEQMEDAGAGFSKTMTEIGDNLSGVPLIGEGISAPFEGASNAGGTLEAAGASQQELTYQVALAVGLGIALLPTLMIITLWLLTRGRFVRKAGQARAIVRAGVGIDLLALRALTNQKMSTLASVDPDPMGAWRRGDEAVMKRLAGLELKTSGIRVRD